MNLFQLVDKSFCVNDTLFIEEKTTLNSRRVNSQPAYIDDLKAAEGSVIRLPIAYRGAIELKIGVRREAYSYTWICEKHLESKTGDTCTLSFDISAFPNGELELTVIAFKDSIISNDIKFVSLESSPGMGIEISPVQIAQVPQGQVLYSFISPTYKLCCEVPLYYKFSGGDAYYSFEDGAVHMKKKAASEVVFDSAEEDAPEYGVVRSHKLPSADLLTYFNAFSACKWHKYTNIKTLSAYVDFCGKAEVELVHRDSSYELCIRKYALQSEERALFELPIGDYPGNGILGFKIYAKGASTLYGGGWLSPDKPTQDVRLGIGITTFKRDDVIKSTVKRLSADIASHPIYHDKIDITVVDNGQTLKPEDVKGATLIPNKNLGGTGGFTRSLIHYQETGKQTHCLFMDDDASCEASSIFRSMAFIRHATDPKSALSGAMLFESKQYLQWENGAWFYGGCHSLKREFDLRRADKLVENEEEHGENIYGAWWFFFFPLAEAKNYSLPFFVRGDDIDFSYANDFKVLSMNGVSCWQQDFKTKEGAQSIYLFLRSHIVHHLTLPQLECPFTTVARFLWGHFFSYNNAYMYGCASCVNLAITHAMEGPGFFEKNMIPLEIFKEIKRRSACEASTPYSLDTRQHAGEFVLARQEYLTRIAPTLLCKLTLYGHLMPRFLIKHTPNDMVYKWMTPDKFHAYRRDQLIVIDELAHKKTVLKRDPIHYLKNFFTFGVLLIKLKLRFKKLRQEYRECSAHQRTREFWKKQFGA